MNKLFYPRLALQNIVKNRRFYVPYILSIVGTVAAFYILLALNGAGDLPYQLRYAYLSAFTGIGCFVVALFAVIFLFYTNSFLMKRRMKELGLYNILGMGKRHIARMLCWETVYTALSGIGLGIATGMLLQKLVTLLLFKLIRFNQSYAFYVSKPGLLITALFFSGILLVNLLVNLLRIHVQNPVELLRGSDTGEKEPKSRWILAIIGAAALGAGYYIALTAQNAMDALMLYFVAVFLVIIGTYCLFTAVSIAVLKLLRGNKAYYYQTKHFIGISGMLYRMKRNAVGLANICILSTMVLVMASGTLSLYLGTEDAMRTRYPADITVELYYDGGEESDFDSQAFMDEAQRLIEDRGVAIERVQWLTSLSFSVGATGGLFVTDRYNEMNVEQAMMVFVTAEDYARATGADMPALAADEVLVSGRAIGDTLCIDFCNPDNPNGEKRVWNVAGQADGQLSVSDYYAYLMDVYYVVVSDGAALREAYDLQRAAYGSGYSSLMLWQGLIDVDADTEEESQCATAVSGINRGGWNRMIVYSRSENTEEMYAMNGGFFFLGMFLSIVFIMAAAMIIYYKQISEGYEDAGRYRIMQQVGLEKADIRRSINSQVLTVFFMPLVVAAVHVAFDFQLMTKLLTLFQLTNVRLTLLCTGAVLVVFIAIYGLVYALTAREYSRIVN